MDPNNTPNIMLTLDNGAVEPRKVTVKFQCGLLRETETFMGDDVRYLNRDSLLDYVADMLCIKVSASIMWLS